MMVQSLSRVQLFVIPWTAACQVSLSITNSRSLLKLMSIESVMASNHLILCCPLLLLPSVFPSIRVFSNESALRIRWPKYWSFSFSISPSSEYSGLISFRMDWFDLLAVQGTLLLQIMKTLSLSVSHALFRFPYVWNRNNHTVCFVLFCYKCACTELVSFSECLCNLTPQLSWSDDQIREFSVIWVWMVTARSSRGNVSWTFSTDHLSEHRALWSMTGASVSMHH